MQSYSTYSKVQSDPRAEMIEGRIQTLYNGLVNDCELCGGTGRIYTEFYDMESARFLSHPCGCLRQYLQLRELMVAGISEGASRELMHQLMWEREAIELDPVKFKNSDPEDIQAYCRGIMLLEDHIFRYIRGMHKVMAHGYSYLFIGNNSTGKTFIALKILRRFLMHGFSGHYVKFRKLMKLINNNMIDRGAERSKGRLLHDTIVNVDLLVVDELGKETGSKEHIAGEIEEVLKDRDAAIKPTIVISNHDYEDLYNDYTVHVVSAFMRKYKILVFPSSIDARELAREEWDL